MSSAKITSTDILCEFLEVAVHNILHTRKLYPETIFETKRKYGVVVYQSIHPDVNDYINHCLKAVNFHAKSNQLKRVFVCFQSKDKFLEKYVFDVVYITKLVESDPFLVDLEQSLRDFIIKLHTSQSYLDDLPEDSSFSIRIETTAYSSVAFNQEAAFEEFPWIELTDIENSIDSVDIVPLHTVKSQFLTLQMFIERDAES